MYGITEKKIIHVIKDDKNNGFCGFYATVCGKQIHPTSLFERVPEGSRMCRLCAKKKAANEVSES